MNNLCDACLQLWLNWLQLWWSEKNKPLRNTGPKVLTSIITRKKKTGERSKFRNEPEDSKSSAYFHAWLELLCQLLFVFRPTQFLLVSVCHHVWVCVCVCRTVRSWDETLRRFSLPHDTRSPRANAGTGSLQMSHTRARTRLQTRSSGTFSSIRHKNSLLSTRK